MRMAVIVLAVLATCCGGGSPASPSSGGARGTRTPFDPGGPSLLTPGTSAGTVVPWDCLTASRRVGIFSSSIAACAGAGSLVVHASRADVIVAGAPSNLASSVTGTTVTLTWITPGSGDAPTSYVIEAGSSSGASNLANFDTGSAATSLTVTAVPPGAYFVRLRARNAAGFSSVSNEIVVTVGSGPCVSAPGTPAGLTASASGSTMTLTWNAPSGACAPTTYIIEAGSSSGASNLANFSTGNTATSFSVRIGTGTYYIRVRAANAAGASGPSTEVVALVGGSVVDARANIFGAGHATVPTAAGGGSGVLPSGFTFAPGAGQVLTFSSVTGGVCTDNTGLSCNRADGGVYRGNIGTDISSLAGISGIVHLSTNMFLVGVFLDNTEPADAAPSRLVFSSPENFTTLAPQLRQTFFIGDGRTSAGGVSQQFLVPAGATRLFLGFADAADPIPFRGRPGFYDDNQGSLSAGFLITGAVP